MLKSIYNSLEEIPEKFRELFEEKEGVFRLVKIEGIKTDADVARVTLALDSEKKISKKLRDDLKSLTGDRTVADVQADLDRIPELEAASEGKLDKDQMDKLVEAKLKTKTAPLERELTQTKALLEEANGKVTTLETKDKTRQIHDAVRAAAVKSKVLDTAQEDALMIAERMFEIGEDGKITAKDGVGVTPGITPDIWLTEMQAKRPHWWAPSGGGGASGQRNGLQSGANNPWSSEHWNLTAQGQYLREHGQEKADFMAKSAGTKVGGTKPVAKKA